MASPAAVLQILVTANTAAATASLARTDAQLKKTTATANTASTAVGTKLARAAGIGATAVGVGLVYGLGKAIVKGAEFEKQMDSVGAVADASGKQMKRLEKQALSLGQQTAFSATEVALAQEELVKGGLKLRDVLGGGLKASLSLAAAGQLELADASAVTVNAMKLFELQGTDAMKVADMLATAANKTTADVADFAIALSQGGSAAKAAGYDLNQTITVLEALAEVGIKNSDAGTSLKTAFLQLLAPTKAQADLARKLNLEFVDQNGNLKDAADLSAELRSALGGMTKAQQVANLKVLAGTDGFRTLNALLSQGPEKLREYTEANEEAGTANDLARKKMDNLAGAYEQFQGAVETLAIKLEKKLGPTLRDFLEWSTDALNKLSNVGPGAAWGKTVMRGTDVLMRDLNEITDETLYDVLAKWQAQGKAINKDQVLHWLRLNKINAEQADRLYQTIDKLNLNVKHAFNLLAAYMRGTATNGIKSFANKSSQFLINWSKKGDGAVERMQKALAALRDGFDKTGDRVADATDKMSEAGERMAKQLGKTTKNVTNSFASMANATGNGLKVMGNNVMRALDAFGVKKSVSFTIEKVSKDVGSVLGAQKGAIVPGSGSGDKVPLHLNGQLAAMVEPGEQVSVMNRNATAAAMAWNQRVPRFAKGGALDFALGPYAIDPIQYAADHAGGNSHWHITGTTTPWVVSIGKKLQQMGFMVGEHPAFGGVQAQHSATGGHYDALAIDVNSAADETRSETAQVARLLSSGGGAIAEKIARVMLKGPDGPLRSMGQGALDRVRSAANKFMSKQAPSVTGGYSAPGGVFSKSELMKLWTAVNGGLGDPNVMAALALSESAGDPRAVGHDPGGTLGLGLWQITTGYNDDIISKYGGRDAMFNPPTNAKAAADILRRQGLGAWYGDYQQFLQRGGVVPHLAKGGSTKGHSMDFSVASGLGVPITEAQKTARKLRNLTGGRGSIAKLDERLAIAQTLADADGVLSEPEIKRQVGLQRSLLRDLRSANKLSTSGYRWAKKSGKRGGNLRALFRDTQTEMSGVTGKGGRIFDTMQALLELKGTSAGLGGMDISGLRSVIEAAQYGAFANLPKFHQGGVVPGPPSREVPLMARGGEVVSPAGATVQVENHFSFDEFGMLVETYVDKRLAKRERIQDTRARQYG